MTPSMSHPPGVDGGGEGTVFPVGQITAADVGNEGVFRGGEGFPGKGLF